MQMYGLVTYKNPLIINWTSLVKIVQMFCPCHGCLWDDLTILWNKHKCVCVCWFEGVESTSKTSILSITRVYI